MERADVQQQAALETAAPPTVERQPGQQRSQAPSYINPRDPRLHLSDPQPRTLSPEPLPPGSAAADASDSGPPASAESEQGQAESSDRQASPTQPAGSEGQQGAEERSQRRCSHCGCSSSGHQWRRHPTTASSNNGDEEAWEEGEEAQPPSQAPAAIQQQAIPVQPLVPGPPVQQGSSAFAIASYVADTRQQQQLRALSQQRQQQPQGVNVDATWDFAPEQPALLPANMPPAQGSTGLLVLEAAQQAAAAAAGLTEGLAGTFAALLPMPPEQDECLRLMLQRRQYSGAAGLMWAVLHVRGIPAQGLPRALPERH
ncbi:hypothetical protein D9Q98_004936 [Chlorella vulgaris]|uniref:Uncharacterized protein n=1 Tax=Chlorella vulgaris TaxID=3077 RepID=A0A9D4TNI3_CHLVU|nr:hypothetical protein D9Q98_004936 [Chlorella vulgaris]